MTLVTRLPSLLEDDLGLLDKDLSLAARPIHRRCSWLNQVDGSYSAGMILPLPVPCQQGEIVNLYCLSDGLQPSSLVMLDRDSMIWLVLFLSPTRPKRRHLIERRTPFHNLSKHS